MAFSCWRIFALCLVISKVSLSLMDLLVLTLNFGWSRPVRFTAIWFHTSPLSFLLYRCWWGSISNTSRHSTNHVCLNTPSPLQRKIEPKFTNVGRQITTVLKENKGGTGYDLASLWPVKLFASRKAGKHKQESFNATRWCFFTNTYIKRFSGVFSTKIQRTNTLKVEHAIDMKFLSGKWI